MVNSRAYPSLERVPGKQNWVDKAGGLPDYIERIAKHLHYEKEMTISHAIATAVNAVKRMVATGDLNYPGKQSANPGSRAQAVKALAQWEAKKKSGKSGVALSDAELCGAIELAIRGGGASGSGKAFDETKYARNPTNGKFGAKLDTNSAEFIASRRTVEAAINNLQVGQTYELPGDVGWVRRTTAGYMIQGGAGVRLVVARTDEAVESAASLLAGKLKELGGEKNV